MPQDHKKLDIYGKAFEFSKDVYRVTAHFPKEEIYGVTNQLRRASSSIGANIAEGAGSQTNKAFTNYLFNSLGSLKECEHFLDLSKDLNYLSGKDHEELKEKLESLGKMLNKFIQRVKG